MDEIGSILFDLTADYADQRELLISDFWPLISVLGNRSVNQ